MLITSSPSTVDTSAASIPQTTSKSSQPKKTSKKGTPTAQKPHSYKRSRALRRGCSFVPAGADHIRWLWAAYKTGSFPLEGRFPAGLSAPEFQREAVVMLRELIQAGHDGVVLVDRDGQHVGFVTVWRVVHPAQVPQFYPHVIWFSWATARNKLECSLHFLIEMKKSALGVIIAEPQNWQWFSHLAQYGVLRRVGTFRGYWADGRDAGIFETVR
jgi:hypothetical protein